MTTPTPYGEFKTQEEILALLEEFYKRYQEIVVGHTNKIEDEVLTSLIAELKKSVENMLDAEKHTVLDKYLFVFKDYSYIVFEFEPGIEKDGEILYPITFETGWATLKKGKIQ